MEQCFTRVIYRSDSAALYEDIFTDASGTERSFYCLIVNQEAYSLSHEEGVLLEKTASDLFQFFHCEGIELTLAASSSLRTTDKLH